MTLLHVPSFGGGLVRLGSPNVQRTDELLTADSLDIGPRGQLVAASDVSDYLALEDMPGGRLPWTLLYGLDAINFGGVAYGVAAGAGRDAGGVASVLLAYFQRNVSASPIPVGQVYDATTGIFPVSGDQMTVVQFPGVINGKEVALINLGARESYDAIDGLGVYVLTYDVATAAITLLRIFDYDSLADSAGLGPVKQLKFRGIVGYNDFVFGWGYDSTDATNQNGPARVMFCNQGNPLKWGNDNISVAAGRAYTDSDAIILGDAGEIVRAGLKWKKRLWFGTNRELHYIAGYGRNSFISDGANAVAKSHNVIGAHAMIEGPDGLMYGVSDQGMWAFDGNTFEPHWRRLVDKDGHSNGLWDLIWTDPGHVTYPVGTNQDLVWMQVDWDREQVIVGIPCCDATAGSGAGNDTVLIKFHVRTGGFTRQVFAGVTYTAASYVRREAQQREVRLLGTATAGQVAVKRYGYQATPVTSPILPVALPRAKVGPYIPFGPDGEGTLRRCYITLAWEAVGSLPLVFAVTITADEGTVDTYTLTIGAAAPGAPLAGDLWLDTSQTDVNLGNATAGTLLQAYNGYLLKTYRNAVWRLVPGMGDKGTRARIPLPVVRVKATRVTVEFQCTAAAGRFQIEDFGINPGEGKEAA